MRVATDSQLLEVQPGDTAAFTVEVINTGQVIDGITTRVLGIPEQFVTADPELLPLFPDASGQVRLDLAVPLSHPAGRHPLTVELVSHGTAEPSTFIDVDLDVAAHPDVSVVPTPRVVRSRRNARFVLEVTNDGNIPLDLEFAASDPDRKVLVAFSPERYRVEPGHLAPILLMAHGPRMITGGEIDRQIDVEITATPVITAPVGLRGEPIPQPGAPTEIIPPFADDQTTLLPGPDIERPPPPQPLAVGALPPLERVTSVAMRQRPFIGRGLLTVLILLSIVGVWAALFLIGLAKVFGGDPMTKEAPASFFASTVSANGSGSSSGAPAGSLPKSGQLPPGLGGTISGKVIAASDAQPVGRILVQAYRAGPNGLLLVSSAATQSDGTYALGGLFPTSYYIQFSAAGYDARWYPNSLTSSAGHVVPAVAQGTTSGINQTIVGQPATISGRIDPGDSLTQVTTVVTARALLGANQSSKPAAVTTTDKSGAYTLSNLVAPNSYQLTFTTPGYTATTIVDSVAGGDKRLEPTVRLGATTGQISGVVSDTTGPIGGATISTTVGGQPLNVMTPTTGQVGTFVLDNLPTPATYVITIAAPGHGSTTTIVDLAAGQSHRGLNVKIASGTGTVTGRVVGPDGTGLGGVTITVGGAAVAAGGMPPTATTLTAGIPGRFAINGLAAPGSYTLTASKAGFASASVPVTLAANTAAPSVTIKLASRLGSIGGVVKNGIGLAFPGATITANNGKQTFMTTSETGDGRYLLTSLAPGTYSVTVTATGLSQQTALVTVQAGVTVQQNLQVGT